MFSLRRHSPYHPEASAPPSRPPPAWEPAPEPSHPEPLYNDATIDSFERANTFCRENPVNMPMQLLPADLERISSEDCGAWRLEPPLGKSFCGDIYNDYKRSTGRVVRLATYNGCEDTCVMSDLPLMAGLYDIRGKVGFYYEVTVRKMNGVIAIGTACKPHPEWRFPGWDRLSAGLHLDDLRKYFEDSLGGRDYTSDLTRIQPGDVIGCGYYFATGALFFTYNGQRLPDAFTGIYLPRTANDVYAAIGVEGENEFEVNFGSDCFKWVEGGEWQWKVESTQLETRCDS
ncbi:hypothetical protein IEO21_04121 [Rhodonia placenta]|uniref:B30.2/SPRY domain-containing protein n=1 Tax=Rhodonia placenta TaxID=104341 RepID=A0A8H7U3I4_9APHY|nr:hypothetical protein IEO21_04121 [Postia placenta]